MHQAQDGILAVTDLVIVKLAGPCPTITAVTALIITVPVIIALLRALRTHQKQSAARRGDKSLRMCKGRRVPALCTFPVVEAVSPLPKALQ